MDGESDRPLGSVVRAQGGGGVLAPSLGTHCEPDPKSSGGESRDRGAVTAPYPYDGAVGHL